MIIFFLLKHINQTCISNVVHGSTESRPPCEILMRRFYWRASVLTSQIRKNIDTTTPQKVTTKKLEYSMLAKNTLRSFSSASLSENGIYCGATSCTKFRHKRVAFRCAQAQPAQSPPLDHGGVASAFLSFWRWHQCERNYKLFKYIKATHKYKI